MAWRLMLFATEEVFVIEAGESECSGQHVEEVVVARHLDDAHEQHLQDQSLKRQGVVIGRNERSFVKRSIFRNLLCSHADFPSNKSYLLF